MRIHTDDFDDFEFFDTPHVRRLMRDEDRQGPRRRSRKMHSFYDYSDDDGDDYSYEREAYRALRFERDRDHD